MKKRILSIVMALAMVLTLLPMAALAADGVSCDGGTDCAHVAAIGDVHYNTLQEAVNAATSGAVITVLKNIEGTDISAGKQVSFGADQEGMEITLDLNQHEVIASAGEAVAINTPNLTLTIKNGTIKNYLMGVTYSDGLYAYQNSNNLTLTLDNVVLDSRTQTLAVQGLTSNSNVTVRNSTLNSDEELGIYYPPKSGLLTIEDSVITAGTGIVVKGSSVRICGSKTQIIADGEEVVPEEYYTGATDGSSSLTLTGDAIYVESGYNDRDIEVTVEGGSLISENGKAIQMYIKDGEATSVERDISITGGTFSTDVSAYTGQGFGCTDNGDGTFTVETLGAQNAAASVTTTEDTSYYKTLAEALAAAESGDTVMLLKNVEENLPSFTTEKELTLDLNSFTVSIPEKSTVYLTNGADLTIKNGGIVAKAFTDGTNALFNIQTDSSITLDDVDVDTTASALFPQGDAASVTVQNGSSIKCGVYGVGTNAATVENYDVVITLKDSAIISTYGYNTTYSKDSCPVMINVAGTLDIDNCTIIGTRQGVMVRAGTATIDNSTIKSTGEYTYDYTGYPTKWGSGTEVPAAALVVGNYQNGAASAYLCEANAVLSNTTVIAENGIPALYVDANATYKGVVTISGDKSYVSGTINNGQYTDKEQIDITISGGYFTSDPSAYLAADRVAVESTVPGYNYTVDTKADTAAEVVVAAPSVAEPSLPEDATEAEETLAGNIKDALTSTELDATAPNISTDVLTAAANAVANENTVTAEQGETALTDKGVAVAEDDTVTIVVQPYMDIKITGVTADTGAETVTLNITPMYKTVATTANVAEDEDIVLNEEDGTVNAVQIGEAKELTVTKPVTITIPLPTDFPTGADSKLYIEHAKSSTRTYFYTGTVDENHVLTFVNPNGFSEFTIPAKNAPVAEINGIGYATLQDAVDEVANGGTITLLANDLSATVSRSVSFTVESVSGESYTADIKAGANYTMTEENGTYTFTYNPPYIPGPTTPAEEFPFTDVAENQWYYTAVKYVYDNDLMDGVSETLFAPLTELNRAMVAQILYNLEGKPAAAASDFTDLKAGYWYVSAVNWAAEKGVVSGYPDGTFKPEQGVTRQELALMLYNYAKIKGYDLTASNNLAGFVDAGETADWALAAMQWAVGNGLLSGKGAGVLDPAGTATRAEVAQIFMQFCENVAK